MRQTLLLVVILAAAGCGESALRVVNRSAQSWTHETGFKDLVIASAEDAARWWGIGPSALDGWTIAIEDGLIDCGDGLPHTGCISPGPSLIQVSTYRALPADRGGGCVEVLPIWHEVGHLALHWDAAHSDPRWTNEPLPVCPSWF
jgi:hypothetical protein